MKSSILAFLLSFTFFCSYAQKTSTISITLKNTSAINVERRLFFEQPQHYSINRLNDDQLRTQFAKGNQLPNASHFMVSKINDQHYVLKYESSKPEMVYVNYKPIFIIPGDKIQLTYVATTNTPNTYADSLIAIGNHNGNYTFSNFTRTKKLDKYYPNYKASKYNGNVKLWYEDFEKYNQLYDRYLDTELEKNGSDRNLIEYIKREHRTTSYFTLMYRENEMQATKSADTKTLTNIIDNLFVKTKFSPADTDYSFTMENLFKRYFERLITIKFNNLKNKSDYDALFSYLKAYPDDFVKEYLLYFFVMNYKKAPKNVNAAEAEAIVEASHNINIRKAFARSISVGG